MKHAADKHQKKVPVEKVFGNILLAVGARHKEKNFLLAIFKLCMDIFLGWLAHLLGFRSVKAKELYLTAANTIYLFNSYKLCMKLLQVNCFLFTWLNVTRKT